MPSPVVISSAFDGGNIQVINASDPLAIQLAIAPDNASDFFQWFYFRLEGEVGQRCQLQITNAGQAAYTEGWQNYRVCTSWNKTDWFRTDCHYADGVLSFEIELQCPSVYFAYFMPYSHERHLALLGSVQMDDRVQLTTLGQTPDGHSMHRLVITDSDNPSYKVWITARQHPGETMAEWFTEGLLDALLDRDNPRARQLLQHTAFYIIPNMNPDGAIRGNLRTNAAGANLNREWLEPTMERSPEVYLVRDNMQAEGGDLFLDIHGDEAIPYNFVAGCEGIPAYTPQHAEWEAVFKQRFKDYSPDFQDQHGYPPTAAGQADLSIATHWLGEHFKTLALTLEMPFKDNANLPDPWQGWSGQRSAQLGRDCLGPIAAVLPLLKG